MDKHNEKLPVWVLTPREEKEARARWKEHAYKSCDDAVQTFVACSKKNGVTVLWNCRAENKAMGDCIRGLQGPEELDKQREILIEEKLKNMPNSKKE